MKDTLIQALRSEYETRRAQNQREEARRLAEVGQREPRIGELVEKRRLHFHARMGQAFRTPNRAKEISDSLRGDVDRFNQEIRSLLKGAGLPEDYLQPIYRCKICRDTGYVGDPVLEMCSCFQQRLLLLHCQEEGMGLCEGERFETYDEAMIPDLPGERGMTQRAYMRRVREVCEAYADAYPKSAQRNLLLTGESGLGKTFLMNCIAHRVLERGYTPIVTTAYRLMGTLKDAQFGRVAEEEARLFFETPLLFIDDFGTEPILENVSIVQWFSLLNERGARALHTVISTNLTPKEIQARYTDRVYSRLMDTRYTAVLRLWGQDLRLKGKG